MAEVQLVMNMITNTRFTTPGTEMSADKIYRSLLGKLSDVNQSPNQIVIGLTWTLAKFGNSYGLAMSPGYKSRTLPWSGDLCQRPIGEIAQWVKSWNGFEASVGMACINAVINAESEILQMAQPIARAGRGNLSVFEHFLPRMKGKKVVVVGRYPGLEEIEKQLDMIVLERNPGDKDLPDPACEYVIPDADWVFLSATSIINKTFPRLAELSSNANLVLMGPSLPWIEQLSEFGVDYLAGVRVVEDSSLVSSVMEGGGVRLFDRAVEYCVYDFSQRHMSATREKLAEVVSYRNRLKARMDAWYQSSGKGRFPESEQLFMLDEKLSRLDSRYKRLWDANQQD